MSVNIVFLRSTSVRFEPVVTKRAKIAQEAGLTSVVMYWDRHDNDSLLVEDGITYLPVQVGKTAYGAGINNLVKRFRYSLRVLKMLKKYKPNIIHACDLDTAIIALFYKKIFDGEVSFIYEILDFIQDFSSNIPLIVRRFVHFIDCWLQQSCDAILIPDESRLARIEKEACHKVNIIYNSPDIDSCDLPDRTESTTGRPLRILYIGGLSVDRGIQLLLDAVKCNPHWELVIGGQGVLESEVQEAALNNENIIWLGAVDYGKVKRLSVSCDLLFAVYDPEYQVNKQASPNKFFEALAFGKPIVVAKGTGIDKRVEELGVGYVIEYSTAGLGGLLGKITSAELLKVGLQAANTFPSYSWALMQSRLSGLYRGLKPGSLGAFPAIVAKVESR